MSNFSFVKNNFQVRSDTKIYDKRTSSAVGLAREKIKDANSRDAFVDANLLVGDFIMQVFPEKNLETDYMFDDFLASAKISKAMDVNSPDFAPFLAVVNIPEITHISTPVTNDGSPEFNRKIRDIIVTLGVFKLYNYTGYEFAVPNYGDPVQVTFKDMDAFTDPIFIRPLKTGVVNFPGAPGGMADPSSYYNNCGRKPNVVTKIPRGSRAPASIITSGKKINKFITSLEQVDIFTGTSEFATKTGKDLTYASTKYEIVIPKNTNFNQPVNVFLYFHGDGNSGRPKKLITEGPSFMPDGYNCIILWPSLGSSTSGNTKYTVTPKFLDAIGDHGLEAGINQLLTFSHSGGGGPHGYFLKQLAEAGTFNSTVTASRFLDADYGFTSITKLFNGLADGSIPQIEQSRITFVVGLDHPPRAKNNAPWQMATKGPGNARWENVYNKGTRLIKLQTGHYPPAYQIGPEYLFPNLVSTSSPPPSSESPSPNDKASENAGNEEKQITESSLGPNASANAADAGTSSATAAAVAAIKGAEKNKKNPNAQLEADIAAAQATLDNYVKSLDALKDKYGGAPNTDTKKGQEVAGAMLAFGGDDLARYYNLQTSIDRMYDKKAKLENELADRLTEAAAKKEKSEKKGEPSKPSKEKEDKNTPNVENSPAPTQSYCPPSGEYYSTPGPHPDDLKWVKLTNFGPRVWQMQRTAWHGYGTVKMQRYLKGLNNVKGGEDVGRGYKNPVSKKYPNKPSKWVPKQLAGTDKLAVPPDAKPGWYFGDISRKTGGDTWNGHLTHQSGIGVDITIPTKYVDPSGRTFRGMNIRVNPGLAKLGKPSGPSPKFWGMKGGTPALTREYIDEVALMSFLLYSIPRCERILFGKDQVAYATELIIQWSREGKEGWGFNTQAYAEAYWPGRKWPEGTKPSALCKLIGDDPVHNNHFHIRLRGPGLAAGPFNRHGRIRYPKDAKPGYDKKGGRWGTKSTTRDQGNGQLDRGQPGFTEPKSTYKK